MQQHPPRRHLLLGGVVQLVLVGAAEALLDARVGPQTLHGGQELLGEGLCVLHAGYDVEDHLGVGLQGKGGKLGQVRLVCELLTSLGGS